jgi:hypothetical protein
MFRTFHRVFRQGHHLAAAALITHPPSRPAAFLKICSFLRTSAESAIDAEVPEKQRALRIAFLRFCKKNLNEISPANHTPAGTVPQTDSLLFPNATHSDDAEALLRISYRQRTAT